MTDAVVTEALARQFQTGGRRNRRVIEAVKGIDLQVAEGERLAFIGPNGAGKSTAIKMLTGVLRPTGGTASVLGLIPWKERTTLARRIGVLFGQRSQLWPELPPTVGFSLLGALYGLDDGTVTQRVAQLGELLDAADLFDQPVRTLSLGQRMRCELAACLLHHPQLLFLDEPTIGLDLLSKQRFRELLVRLNQEDGTTIFLTSHDVADIEHVADRAVIVNDGRIIYDAPVEAMRRRLLATKRIELRLASGAEGRGDAAALPDLGIGTTVVDPGRTTAVADDHRRDDDGEDHSPADGQAHHVIDVDTAIRPVGDVLQVVLRSGLAVADVSVLDPPLEQVIGEIYDRGRP